MKICAFAMVYRDYWALAQWYRHYSSHLGAEHIYVLSHGADPKVREICKGATVVDIPRDDLSNFDRCRFDLMNAYQASLLQRYDWVIQGDADEIVCLDPERFSSFDDLFRSHPFAAMFGLGFDLIEVEGDLPAGVGSVFAKRTAACFTGRYSKCFAVSEALPLKYHGVECGNARLVDFEYLMPDGVFVCHLKYANAVALADCNLVRSQVASSDAAMSSSSWRNASDSAARFYRKASSCVYLDWDEAIEFAYSKLKNNPVRDVSSGVLRSKFETFICTTNLPGWFMEC